MSIKIPSTLESTSANGVIANANAINDVDFVINNANDMYDTLLQSVDGKQSTINAFLYKKIQGINTNNSGSYDNSELEKIKARLDNLTIKEQYDLTTSTLPTNIYVIGDKSEFTYNANKKLTKLFGTIKIICPRKSSWYVNLSINDDFDKYGTISTDTETYTLATNMFIIFNHTDVCTFTCNVPIYLKAITLTEYTVPDVPTKVSDLENDLNLVNTKIEDEALRIDIATI